MLPRWAWRFLVRHLFGKGARPAVRWMNAFALLGLTIGMAAWLIVSSVMTGLQNDIKDRMLSEMPHLLWEGKPQTGLEEKRADLEKLFGKKLKELKFVLQTEGLLDLLDKNGRSRSAGAGVIIEGVPGLGNQVLAGKELIEMLDLAPGTQVALRSPWRLQSPPLIAEVGAAIITEVYELDRLLIRIDQERLGRWLNLPRAVSRVEIALVDPFDAPLIRESAQKIAGLPLKTWQESHASLWYSLKMEKVAMGLALFFVVLLATLSVHLALSLRIAEKIREIALLKALGASDVILHRLYLMEGLALGLGGSTLGLVIGWILCRVISRANLLLPEFYYQQRIPVEWSWSENLALWGAGLALSVLASWLPARRVLNANIQEALRA